jgi:hypothetical protein
MGEMDEMDALVKDRLDQELDSFVPIADGPDFAATLEGLLAKSRARFEGRGAMHRRAKS